MTARLVSADSDNGRLPDIVLNDLASRYAPIGSGSATQKVFAFNSTGDQTSRLQDFFNTVADNDSVLLTGSGQITTASLAANGVLVTFHPSCKIIKTTALTDGLVFTGNDVSVRGGYITSPTQWDGTNSTPTYAVIRSSGHRFQIHGTTLINVPRVGIAVRDGDGTSVISECKITGNYPASSWNEVETVNFGIMFDPGINSSNAKIINNTIKSCVQGLFLANYGNGSSVGTEVIGNDFEGCHNHAIYAAGGVDSITVASNATMDCSRPVALTGDGHIVALNTFNTTGTGGNLNAACGIQIRNGSNCAVLNNQMKGDVFATAPAIDISHVSGGVSLSRNRVVGNTIEILGTNQSVGIRVGTSASTTMRDNVVQGNTVKGPGVANQGVISFFASNSSGLGNKCLDNIVIVTGPSNGIHVNGQVGLDVRGNRIAFEYNAVSATTLGGIYLDASSSRSRVQDNDILVGSAFGTNVTVRGIWEGSGTTANRTALNRFNFDGPLTGFATHFLQGTSGSIVDEVLAGAPTFVCGPGSRWLRTDGGASTTLYVKETASNSGVWRAV